MKDTSQLENLLMDYSKIEETNYKARVQFYEDKQKTIKELLLKDKVEFDVDYAYALFELGKYRKCIKILNQLIVTVISDNIFTIKERDVYQDLLFKKAACHYNLSDANQSNHILEELIRINPSSPSYQGFYKKCYRNDHKLKYRWMGGFVVALFLVSALIVPIELLVVKPFFNDWSFSIEFLRNGLFFSAIFIAAIKEYLFHRSFSQKLKELT